MTHPGIPALGPGSVWMVATPNTIASALPFSMSEMGLFEAQAEFGMTRSARPGCYLLLTLSGRGALKSAGSAEEEDLTPGTLALWNSAQEATLTTRSRETWVYYWVHLEGESALSYLRLLEQEGSHTVRLPDPEPCQVRMETLLEITRGASVQRSVEASLLLDQMLTQAVMERYSLKNNRRSAVHQDDINRVIRYIQEHYAEPVSLDDLMEVVHLSKYYFLKLFKQYTGLSPYEYLINYRISQAKRLLRTTDHSIGAIAGEVGFLDESNFIKQFKKITGCKPLVYRKQSW